MQSVSWGERPREFQEKGRKLRDESVMLVRLPEEEPG